MSDLSDLIEPISLGKAASVGVVARRDQRGKIRATRVKRAIDVILALALLIGLSPFFVIITLLITLYGQKPFFVHSRAGLHGRPFSCLKFRTMVSDADVRLAAILASDPKAAAEWRQNFKLTDDPRVTTIGRVLRKTSLDELPQLWNVLSGDMSIVGPRPVTGDELELYGSFAGTILSVRPGMTGLWQVLGRGQGITYAERVQLDLSYVQTMNLRRDATIICKTARVVFQRTGE